MVREVKLRKRVVLLVLVCVLLVSTWALGGLSGFSNSVGAMLPWLTAVFGGIYEAFERALNWKQIGNLRFGLMIAIIFVFALIPVSGYSPYGISVSATLAALTVLAYVLYASHLSSKHPLVERPLRQHRITRQHLLTLGGTFPAFDIWRLS